MSSEKDLFFLLKRLSTEAFEASKPVKIEFGEVIGISPLQIQLDQKFILSTDELILTRNVTDYSVDMTVDHKTEDTSDFVGDHTHVAPLGPTDNGTLNISHTHPYVGKKSFLVHNSLVVGEKVILIRIQNGQKYIVIDRIG